MRSRRRLCPDRIRACMEEPQRRPADHVMLKSGDSCRREKRPARPTREGRVLPRKSEHYERRFLGRDPPPSRAQDDWQQLSDLAVRNLVLLGLDRGPQRTFSPTSCLAWPVASCRTTSAARGGRFSLNRFRGLPEWISASLMLRSRLAAARDLQPRSSPAFG